MKSVDLAAFFSLNVSHYDNPVLVSFHRWSWDQAENRLCHEQNIIPSALIWWPCVSTISLFKGQSRSFFLDYIAMGALDNDVAAQIVEGIAQGCSQSQCALIGGETAEMPGLYQDGEYDLSGFSVGIVDNRKIIDGSEIRNGHKLIGLASSGVHSNGFSLVRKICF